MSYPGFEGVPTLTTEVALKADQFVHILSRYHTINNPASAPYLAEKLSINRAQVSALRKLCWKRGIPIGTNGSGFYYCWWAKDFDKTLEHLEARVRAGVENVRLVRQMIDVLNQKATVVVYQEELPLLRLNL